MKFTILGGGGFVGSHLVEYLRAANHEVTVPARNALPDPMQPLGHVIYSIGLTGDFRNRPFDTIDAHANALALWLRNSSFDSLLYLSSTRIYGTNPVDTSEDSSITVRPDADGLYDLSKLLGESLCSTLNRDSIKVARLSNIYGPGMSQHTFLGSLIKSASLCQSFTIGEHPASSKDYISIRDAVSSIEKIILHGKHRLYNIASGQNTTHREIADALSSALPVSISFDADSGLRRFPLINTARLQSEFPFTPSRLLDDLPGLIDETTTRNKKGPVYE